METSLKTILVDDEDNALSILEIKLKKFFPQAEIIGKYNNPAMAIDAINSQNPDLLFLDVKMPNCSGFELLDHIWTPTFELIFVTAYGEYALEAIKQCAIGYVLKPIDDDEFKSAVLNAINKLQSKTKVVPNHAPSKITIPFANGFMVKEIQTIVRCEGFSGYTKIHLNNGEIITSSYSIGLFNSLLNIHGFIMVHKSHLINTNAITVYYNDGMLELSNKDKIPVSKANRAIINKLLKN
jgi:two-component system, LytTR family, response regulator